MIDRNIVFVVAIALIAPDGRILLQQRPEGRAMAGLWEFPGGKVETGETPETGLIRELQEELGIIVQPDDLFPVSFASEALGDKHLLLLLYGSRSWEGEPVALHASALDWVAAKDMSALAMPAADGPLVDALVQLLESGAQPVK